MRDKEGGRERETVGKLVGGGGAERGRNIHIHTSTFIHIIHTCTHTQH